MLSLGSIRLPRNTAELGLLLNQTSPAILVTVVALASFHHYLLVLVTNGGSDLLSADIPKSLMLLHGQNPYSVQPWASPYPPLLLLTVGGIIQLTGPGLLQPSASLGLISQNIRIVGLFANALVGIIIFLALRSKGLSGLQALVPAALFLTLPATSTGPLYYFHSDTFGYPILALSALALTTGRYFTGSTLLATATIFKVHPILALPLILVWLVRKQGLQRALPSLLTSTTILAIGLALPLGIPGYSAAILGFNLSNTGNGTASFTILNLLYGVLPTALSVNVPDPLTTQVWIATTATLFTVMLGIIWLRAQRLDPIDVVLIGLLAWLIPLRQLYLHYLVWAIIPFLMRGRLKQTILVAIMLESGELMGALNWSPALSPIPGMGSVYGFFATSLTFLLLGIVALRIALKGSLRLSAFPVHESDVEKISHTLGPTIPTSPVTNRSIRKFLFSKCVPIRNRNS